MWQNKIKKTNIPSLIIIWFSQFIMHSIINYDGFVWVFCDWLLEKIIICFICIICLITSKKIKYFIVIDTKMITCTRNIMNFNITCLNIIIITYIYNKKNKNTPFLKCILKWKTWTFINHKHEGEQHYIATCYPPFWNKMH